MGTERADPVYPGLQSSGSGCRSRRHAAGHRGDAETNARRDRRHGARRAAARGSGADADVANMVVAEVMTEAFVETFPGAPTVGIVEVHVGQNWAELKG